MTPKVLSILEKLAKEQGYKDFDAMCDDKDFVEFDIDDMKRAVELALKEKKELKK